MDKSLFHQAKEAIENFINNNDQLHSNMQEQDKEAVKQTIQAAYSDATPEERELLKDFEQKLESKNSIH